MDRRPSNEEYHSFFKRYVDLVPEGRVDDLLLTQLEDFLTLLSDLTEEQQDYRYAPEKWTLKEVIGHVLDTERILSNRLLRFARGDQTPLSAFDQNAYVEAGSFSSRALPDLLEEYTYVRRATVALIRGLQEEAWSRVGIANNNNVTVRALAYIIAGHERHHVSIMKERYLAL